MEFFVIGFFFPILFLLILLLLILMYARQISFQRQADRHEKQRHAENMKIIQYLDAIYKSLNQ